jgi:hypothetical protein
MRDPAGGIDPVVLERVVALPVLTADETDWIGAVAEEYAAGPVQVELAVAAADRAGIWLVQAYPAAGGVAVVLDVPGAAVLLSLDRARGFRYVIRGIRALDYEGLRDGDVTWSTAARLPPPLVAARGAWIRSAARMLAAG